MTPRITVTITDTTGEYKPFKIHVEGDAVTFETGDAAFPERFTMDTTVDDG